MLKISKIVFHTILLLSFSHCLSVLHPENVLLQSKLKNTENDSNIIPLKIGYQDGQKEILIDDKGTFSFKTECTTQVLKIFSTSEIEKETAFRTSINSRENKYVVICRLSRQAKVNLNLVCNLETNLDIGTNQIFFNGGQFMFKEYIIKIASKENFYKVRKNNMVSPLLYSEKNITLRIQYMNNNQKVGPNGIIYFIAYYDDDETKIFDASDLDEKTSFSTIIKVDYSNYDAECRLWNPRNKNIVVLCDINQSLNINYYYIDIYKNAKLNNSLIEYNGYKIYIVSDTSIRIGYYKYDIPFLYSNKQSIDINDEMELYYLKFKIMSYNNEIIFINGEAKNAMVLDRCTRIANKLNCEIAKGKIEEILISHNEQFKVGVLNDNYGIISLDLILNITINHNIKEKKDIFVGIKKILDAPYYEIRKSFGYETNITDIPNLITGSYYIEKGRNTQYYNYFKKITNNSLLYLIYSESRLNSFQFDITEEIIFDNIHYKYNFRVQPFTESKSFFSFILELMLNFYIQKC